MTRVKTLSELEIEDQDYLEKQRVEQAHREKEPLVIDKSQLDQLVITTDAYLNEIMKSNVASQTKWKNSQK